MAYMLNEKKSISLDIYTNCIMYNNMVSFPINW